MQPLTTLLSEVMAAADREPSLKFQNIIELERILKQRVHTSDCHLQRTRSPSCIALAPRETLLFHSGHSCWRCSVAVVGFSACVFMGTLMMREAPALRRSRVCAKNSAWSFDPASQHDGAGFTKKVSVGK